MRTHDLHSVPEREAERIDARPRIESLDPADRAERDREPHRLAVERGKCEVWWEEVELACLRAKVNILLRLVHRPQPVDEILQRATAPGTPDNSPIMIV